MRNSRLSRSQQKRLVEHFVAATTARTGALLVGVNKSTAAYYFHRLRQLIYEATEDSEFHAATWIPEPTSLVLSDGCRVLQRIAHR